MSPHVERWFCYFAGYFAMAVAGYLANGKSVMAIGMIAYSAIAFLLIWNRG